MTKRRPPLPIIDRDAPIELMEPPLGVASTAAGDLVSVLIGSALLAVVISLAVRLFNL